MNARHEFLWFDVETTGLDPREGVLLEWGLVLAADDRDGDMRPLEQYSAALHWHGDRTALHPRVREMHERSGLLDECAASTTTARDSDDALHAICCALTRSPRPRGLVLAGFSPHFDLAWVRAHLPRFASCLSHRVFDVSTLKRALTSWGGGEPLQSGDAHRALDDALVSLDVAAQWRRLVWPR